MLFTKPKAKPDQHSWPCDLSAEERTSLAELHQRLGLPSISFPPVIAAPRVLSFSSNKRTLVAIGSASAILIVLFTVTRACRNPIALNAPSTPQMVPAPVVVSQNGAGQDVRPARTIAMARIQDLEKRIVAACASEDGDEARRRLKELATLDLRCTKPLLEKVRHAEWRQSGREIRATLDMAEASFKSGQTQRGLAILLVLAREAPWWRKSEAQRCRLWVISGRLGQVRTLFGQSEPDVYVQLEYAGHPFARTAIQKATRSPIWRNPFPVGLDPTQSIHVVMKDHRLFQSDVELLSWDFRAGVIFGAHIIPGDKTPELTLVLLPEGDPLPSGPPTNWKRRKLFRTAA